MKGLTILTYGLSKAPSGEIKTNNIVEQEHKKLEEKAKKWFDDVNNQIIKVLRKGCGASLVEIKLRDCEIPDEYVLKSDVVEAIEKLKERYPNFIPAIDETFESVICWVPRVLGRIK